MEADALELTQIAQRLSDVRREQQIDCAVEVQTSELVRSLTVPYLLAHSIAPGANHGKNILRGPVNTVTHKRQTDGLRQGLMSVQGLDTALATQ